MVADPVGRPGVDVADARRLAGHLELAGRPERLVEGRIDDRALGVVDQAGEVVPEVRVVVRGLHPRIAVRTKASSGGCSSVLTAPRPRGLGGAWCGPVEAGGHGARGHAEDLGHGVVVEALAVDQDHGDPLGGGEVREGLADDLRGGHRLGGAGRRRGVVDGLVGRQRVALPATDLVDAGVVGDPVEPATELAARPEPAEALEGLEVGLLEGVVHAVPVRDEPEGEAPHPVVVAQEQLVEGGAVAVSSQLDQLDI